MVHCDRQKCMLNRNTANIDGQHDCGPKLISNIKLSMVMNFVSHSIFVFHFLCALILFSLKQISPKLNNFLNIS